MFYRLRSTLSFCQVDGQLIFLDLEGDRYFQLSGRAESVFLAYLDGEELSDGDAGELVRRKILTHAPVYEDHAEALSLAPPAHSGVEQPPVDKPFDIAALLEVFVIVCSTQLQLKTRRLHNIIDGLASYRQKRMTCVRQHPAHLLEQHLLKAASIFRSARLYVPVETSCLLDALSMVRFLARRRLPSRIVFGVTIDPFAAHCWVQAGDWVLSDTVGNATAHTAIRVV